MATRHGMRLYKADCHLQYARLEIAGSEWEKARISLSKAKRQIDEMGYHRRDPDIAEVEDYLERCMELARTGISKATSITGRPMSCSMTCGRRSARTG